MRVAAILGGGGSGSGAHCRQTGAMAEAEAEAVTLSATILPWLRNSQLTTAYVLDAYSLCAHVYVACKFLRWADGTAEV